MPSILYRTLKKTFVCTPESNQQDRPTSQPQPNVAGRRRQIHNLRSSFNTCDRDVVVEPRSTTHSSPLSISAPDSVKLPALSFSYEDIFPCEALHNEDQMDIPLDTSHKVPSQFPSSNLRIRSVTHPNSPYVPWSEDQRQWIFASAETLHGGETVTSNSPNQWTKSPDTGSVPGTSRWRVFGCYALGPLAKCFRPLRRPSARASSCIVQPVIAARNDFDTSTLSSVQTNSLEVWLAEKRQEASFPVDGTSLHGGRIDSWTCHSPMSFTSFLRWISNIDLSYLQLSTRPCKWTATQLNSLPHSRSNSPFYRALFAPYTPLWVNPNPQTQDNSPSVKPEETPTDPAEIDHRLAFERKHRVDASYWDSTVFFGTLYAPKGRWQWTHQVTFENRAEEVPISHNRQYTLTLKTAKIYEETINYISKSWRREDKWEGFASEVALHKTQLRSIQGAAVPALIGVHTNFDGIQMTYDVPHHSFWIQASPDMPDVLKRRCLQAYDQLHSQGVLHGSVEFENILIGGDGRVKIINFERSRSTKPNRRVELAPADSDEFKMEMREVHYKLDYMGAREKERIIWDSRRNPQDIRLPAGQTSRIHSRYPYSISRDPPVDPTKWSLPRLWKPQRFVVPGQSADQFHYHVKQFLFSVAEEAGEGMDPPIFLGPTSQKLKKTQEGTRTDDDGRRVRFEQETEYSDGTTRIKRRLAPSPPPGKRRVVPRIPRERRESSFWGPTGYAPNVPPRNDCPHIPPAFDQRRFLQWDSSRAHQREVNDTSERGKEAGERTLEKRRQVDDSEIPSEDPPRAKRLRRTETTLSDSGDSGTQPPSTSSSSRESPPASPRYALRSSRRPQSSATRPSRPSTRRSGSLVDVPESRRQTRRMTTNPVSRSSSAPSIAMTSSSADFNNALMSVPPASPQARFTENQLTSATSISLGSHTGVLSTEFGPVQVISYDQLANYQPVESRSAIDAVRLVAGQLPNTLITAANRLARTFTFGLW
ncbi:hypothetical protein NP233_g8415 [Leucocoprinus birnbaumii]|uniref:Protein kinase domain-containing protein n=1 Tax=Leucocoprinus birnbaumii TaxID=56174 RepID=A0AAD5VPT9_9AGAR|nr:hypothetical protein NP233_g8415 [Leucocoprinus birnbaumii]